MKSKRKAFTLVEILLSLMLLSVLAVLAIRTLRTIADNNKYLYHAAYRNIKQSVGEITSTLPNAKLSSIVAPATFCSLLVDNFTTIGGSSTCTYTYLFSPSLVFNDLPTGFSLSNPSFVLTNGQKFYVGSGLVAVGSKNYFNQPATLILVDLNGDDEPNTMDTRGYAEKRLPDIAAFAIMQDGTVLPMSPISDRDDSVLASVQVCNYQKICPAELTDISDTNNYSQVLLKRVPLREAIAVSNSFPPNVGSPLLYQYNTDNSLAFNKVYTVNSLCSPNSTTYCRVRVHEPRPAGFFDFL